MDYAESCQLSQEVQRCVASVRIDKTKSDKNGAVCTAIYSRCAGLYEAIVQLVEKQKSHEGWILARSLFEESIRLQVFAGAGEQRPRYVAGYLNNSVLNSENLLREAEGSGILDDAQKRRFRQALQERKTILQTEWNVGKHKPLGGINANAKRLGRQRESFFYLIGHLMTHGDVMSTMGRSKRKDQDVDLFTKGAPDQVTASLTLFAGRSILLAANSIVSILGLEDSEALSKQLAEIDKLWDQGES